MHDSSISPFKKVAGSLKAIDIALPIKLTVSPDELMSDIWENNFEYDDVFDEFIIVKDSSKIYGYLHDLIDFEKLEGIASDNSHPISADMIISSSTPIADLPNFFIDKYFYFIIEGNRLTHYISFNQMDSLMMKLCLFSLIIDIEHRILKLLMIQPNDCYENFLGSLNKNRREKAEALCELKYKKINPSLTLKCTTFIDKKTILHDNNEFKSKLHLGRKEKFEKLFSQVEFVRNQIAHSESIFSSNDKRNLDEPAKLYKFINDIEIFSNNLNHLIIDKCDSED